MVLRNRIAHNTLKNHGFAYSPARAGHRSRFLLDTIVMNRRNSSGVKIFISLVFFICIYPL